MGRPRKAGDVMPDEWAVLAPAIRAIYAGRMRLVVDYWGELPAAQTDTDGVVALRDTVYPAPPPRINLSR